MSEEAYRSRQSALQQRCVHRDGGFVAFPRAALEQGLPARFEQQVHLHGDRLAVSFEGRDLRYSELNCLANVVAHALLSISDQRRQPVALLIEQGAASIAAWLGVLKAGKAVVPLDSQWPSARASWVLRHSGAAVLLTTARNLPLARAIVEAGQRIVIMDELPISQDCANPRVEIHPDDPAYILYTSGSTGRPKGVLDSHRNLLHEVMRLTNALHVCPYDRQSLLRANSAGAVSDTFTALLNGAALLPFDVMRAGAAGLVSWLGREEITLWRSAPSLFRALAGALRPDELLPHLRVLFLCGEPANGADLERYRTHCGPSCLFINCLGSTEAATVTLHFSDRDTPAEPGILPVGLPVEDMQVQLLDEGGAVIPGEGEGEIVVRSRYLACGYFEAPELTASAFREDPIDPAFRRFFSGDIGQRRGDGNLVCLGRRDWRVNVRGQKFEPAEIETALQEVGGIREAVAVVAPSPRGSPQVVAYVVPDRSPGPTAAVLRRALQPRIPAYMIPARFVTLERIPLTATGKVDRAALPAPDTGPADGPDDSGAPHNSLEQKLIEIWRRLFQREDIGRHADFFALGGDSLLALELSVALESEVGWVLSLATLFHAPTIEELARRIGERDWTPPWRSLVPLQPLGDRPPLFVVHGIGGDTFAFLELARRLAPDQPVHGLQAVGLDGREPRHTSVNEMAAHYATEIRSRQPTGPYHLAGYSSGGWFAYAVAEALCREGERIALLGLLDTAATCDLPRRVKLRLLARRAQLHLGALWSIPRGQRLRFLSARLRALGTHATHVGGITRTREDYYDALLPRYRPGRLAGDVVLILGERADLRERARLWRLLVKGRVDTCRVSGGHSTLLSEGPVDEVARIFRERLADHSIVSSGSASSRTR